LRPWPSGFFIYGVGANTAVAGQVSAWIMVGGYGLYSLGELLVSGLGLAMIARYVPARMGGFMMGAYFVANGLSQYLGSVVANVAHIPAGLTDPVQSIIGIAATPSPARTEAASNWLIDFIAESPLVETPRPYSRTALSHSS
jgi:dipeptide/tripeptide permease